MKKIKYLGDIIKLSIAKFISPILKLIFKNKREIWLIGERKSEAKDNGYHLFKYIRVNHPKDKVYYVIDKNSKDLDKILSLDNIIYYDSLKHYIYYIMSSKLICAHLSSCVPDSPVCWKFHGNEMKNKRMIFIQHGITKEIIPSLIYENTKADLFVCGAKPEYDFIREKFGYPEENVKYLGFSRFDNLHDINEINQILVMPTWRQWIPSMTWSKENKEECRNIFMKSEYYKRFNGLLNNQKLIELLNKNNMRLIFYPHYEMQSYIDLFETESDKIIIANKEDYDVQVLLKESKILITDYSSVAFDFAYMRKPLIYYQFDYEKYNSLHYTKGYFDYKTNGFGPVVNDEDEVLLQVEKYIKCNFKSNYLTYIDDFFEIYDKENSNRIYNEINNIKKR